MMRSPQYEASVMATVGRRSGAGDAQAFRDADAVREFVTGAAILAFFEMPWVPLFVAAAFLLNPIFGWLAIGTGILTFMIAVANEYLTRRSLSRATQSSISAHADVAATLPNPEVIRPMSLSPALTHPG